MSHNLEPTRIHIAAPDGPAAFALEQRLSHLRPVTIGVDGDWTVELEDTDDRLDEIEAAVRHWLRERHLGSTAVAINGITRMISAVGEQPLGAGYDGGPTLTHEP